MAAICDLRRGHALEGRKRVGVEPAGSRRTADQGDRRSCVLPLSVHHGGDGARAHGVCQEHSRVRGPLPQ